jgi:hypothetical protein
MDEAEGDLTKREQVMAEVLQFHTITVTAKITVVEARSRAIEGVLADLISRLEEPPFPFSELPDRIRQETVRQAESILSGMADTSGAIASGVRDLIDKSSFGPFPDKTV